MNFQFLPLTETERQRNAWFKERAKPGMTMDEFIRLNEEALHMFPRTGEERRQKTESLRAIPEFVL